MTHTLYRGSLPEPPRHAGRLSVRLMRRVKAHALGFTLLLAAALLTLYLGATEPGFAVWVETAAWRAFVASLRSWAALLLFYLLVLLLYGAVRWRFLLAGPRTESVLPMMVAVLLLILAVNAFPIAVYIIQLERFQWHRELVTVASLLLANAMLYFFFNSFFRTLWAESHRLYAVSAWFKGTTPIQYVTEKVQWTLLADMKQLFLYIFSFTLFTDYLLSHTRSAAISNAGLDVQGIVGVVFGKVFTSGWTTQVWVYLLVLWLVLWPQRALLDGASRLWMHLHRVSGDAAARL